mgnify:CR=1 FL=1
MRWSHWCTSITQWEFSAQFTRGIKSKELAKVVAIKIRPAAAVGKQSHTFLDTAIWKIEDTYVNTWICSTCKTPKFINK